MRLHNFCIDERLVEEDDMPSVQAHVTEVQPDRYCRPPLFDKDGRPVDYLQTAHKDAEGAPHGTVLKEKESASRAEMNSCSP